MTKLTNLKAKINSLVQLSFPQVEDWTNDLIKMMIPTGLKVQLAIELEHCTLRQVVDVVDQVDNHTTAANRYHRWQRQINNAYRQIIPLPAGQPLDEKNSAWIVDNCRELIRSLSQDIPGLYKTQNVQYFSRVGALIQVYSCLLEVHDKDRQTREIQSLYRRGLTSQQILDKTGYSIKTVSTALSGLTDGERLKRRNSRILKMYIKDGSVRKAAKRYGLGITTVSNIIKSEADLPSLEAVRNKYNIQVADGRRHFSDKDIDQILKNVETYLEVYGPHTLQHVAGQLNLTYGSLRRWIKRDPRIYYQQDKYPHILMLKK